MSATTSSFVPGQLLFEQRLPPSGRQRVALFSEATQDPNPIHVDDQFAQRAGFPTVLQQGPMTTAQFARLLEQTVGGASLRVLDVTFTAPVFPEDSLTLRAEVVEVGAVEAGLQFDPNQEGIRQLRIEAYDQVSGMEIIGDGSVSAEAKGIALGLKPDAQDSDFRHRRQDEPNHSLGLVEITDDHVAALASFHVAIPDVGPFRIKLKRER